jgi:hypothetical protein
MRNAGALLLLVLFFLALSIVAHDFPRKKHTTAHHQRKKYKDAQDVVLGDGRIGDFRSVHHTLHAKRDKKGN